MDDQDGDSYFTNSFEDDMLEGILFDSKGKKSNIYISNNTS